eukprot:g32370.t1
MASPSRSKEVVINALGNGQVWVEDLGWQSPTGLTPPRKAAGAKSLPPAPPLPGSNEGLEGKRCAGAGRVPRAGRKGDQLSELRDALAQFRLQGRAALSALQSDLDKLLDEQSQSFLLANDLKRRLS